MYRERDFFRQGAAAVGCGSPILGAMPVSRRFLRRAGRRWARWGESWEKLGDGLSDSAPPDPDARRRANREAVIVLLTAALSLTFLNFAATGHPSWLITLLDRMGWESAAEWLREALTASPLARRNRLIFWGAGQVAAYTLLPWAAVKWGLRGRWGDYGLRLRGTARYLRPYAWLLAVSVPFVVWASASSEFQAKYPFYDLAPGEGIWPHMAVWWGVYALQFAALEMFFRGFLLHGLEARFGYLAVFVMVVPYNMLHFSKPAAEAVAAIAGGTVLGFMSLRSRTVWWGAVLHIAVAMTMDISSLVRKGLLW